MVVREAAVHLGEQLGHPGAEPPVDRGRHRSGGTVAGVDDDVDRAREPADVLDHEVLIDRPHRPDLGRTGALPEAPRLDPAPEVLDLLAVERLLAEADLEAVVVGGVVAARHLDAAVQVPVEEREVEERRRADADVDHREPGRANAVGQGRRVAVGGEPAVAADAHPPPARLAGERAEGPAERGGEAGVEVALRHAPDVVLAEDRRIHSSSSTWCRSRRSRDSHCWKRASSASL